MWVWLLVCAGCSSGENGASAPAPVWPDSREAAARNGFSLVLAEQGRGFLAEAPGSGPPARRLLYLEGTHAEMGYQMGTLCPEDVRAMAIDYTNGFLFDMLELPFSYEDLGPLWDLFRAEVLRLVAGTDPYLPDRFRDEIRGVVAGVRDAGTQGRVSGEVSYEDLLLLNQGVDVLLALADAAGAGTRAGIACNQFACWGPHTRDGRLFHGRDFQYYTAGVYQDLALVSICRPLHEDGSPDGNPFVSVSAPGFVGQMTGMNDRGISVGINLESSWAANATEFGLGGVMLVREVLERAGTLEDAVRILSGAPRGCPWLFVIADAGARSAVVLETVSNFAPEPWMEEQLAWGEAFGSWLLDEPLSSGFPAAGVMERRADYVVPARYQGKGIFIPGYCNDPAFPDDHTLLNFRFSEQHEDSPHLVAAANHFLRPELRPLEWGPVFSLLFLPAWSDSEWRYETNLRILLGLSTGGQTLDREAAWEAIDFLNPETPEGAFYWGPDPNQQVHGHVALMDGADLAIRARYGYYNQAPVEVRFGDFLP